MTISDISNEASTKMVPANLIIGGVNKAATTSLYTYLSEHPDICASSIKETNYFLPVIKGNSLQPIETYAEYFNSGRNCRYRMEASPRYIFGGARIAETIRSHLGSTRVIFVFRNPIGRMISYFKHMQRNAEVPAAMSCEEYARRALEELPSALATGNGQPVDVYRQSVFVRGVAQGFYADYLKEWYEVFPDTIRVCFFEDLSSDPRAVVQEVCTWLGLDSSMYQNSEFTQENRSIKHKNISLFKIAAHVNDSFEPFWRRHTKLKRWIRDVYCWMNTMPPQDGDMSPSVRAELELVYAPWNQKLLTMLSQKGYRNFPSWLGQPADSSSKAGAKGYGTTTQK